MTRALLALLFALVCSSQEPVYEGAIHLAPGQSIGGEDDESAGSAADFDLSRPAIGDVEPESARICNAAVQAYYQYRIESFDHRRRVYEWQLFSSRLIFYVVVLLVLSGIYFAGVQFHAGLRGGRSKSKAAMKTDSEGTQGGTASASEDAPGTTKAAPVVTQLEVSPTGIKVSSPILGVIILVISFAFFYLYLRYVYPVFDSF